MKVLLKFLLFIFFISPVYAMAQEISHNIQISLTETSLERNLKVTKGENFSLALEAQAGTGYSWHIKKLNSNYLSKLDLPANSKPINEVPKLGGIEEQNFSFKAIKAGKTQLELVYIRPWEKDQPPLKLLKITLEIFN